MIEPPSNLDLEEIVIAWYPNLEPLAKKLVGRSNHASRSSVLGLCCLLATNCAFASETFEGVNSVYLHQSVGFNPGKSVSLSSLSKFSLR